MEESDVERRIIKIKAKTGRRLQNWFKARKNPDRYYYEIAHAQFWKFKPNECCRFY